MDAWTQFHIPGPSCSYKLEYNTNMFGLIESGQKIKDAGFVYKSFWNETNQVIWNFLSYETNLWKTGLQNESTIRIFKVRIRESASLDSFCAIVLRIRQDSLDLWKQVESLEVQVTKRIHDSNL